MKNSKWCWAVAAVLTVAAVLIVLRVVSQRRVGKGDERPDQGGS